MLWRVNLQPSMKKYQSLKQSEKSIKRAKYIFEYGNMKIIKTKSEVKQ